MSTAPVFAVGKMLRFLSLRPVIVLVLLIVGACCPERMMSITGKSVPKEQYQVRLPVGAAGRLGCLWLKHRGGVEAISVSSDGKVLASCGREGMVLFSELPTGKPVGKRRYLPAFVYGACFSPNQKSLAWVEGVSASSKQQRIHVWDLASWKQEWKDVLPYDEAGNVLIFSPAGDLLAAGGPDGIIRIWQAGSGKLLYQIPAGEGNVSPLAFSADGKFFWSGGACSSIAVWETSSGRLVRRLGAETLGVFALALSADGKTAAYIGKDYWLRLFNVSHGKEIWSRRPDQNNYRSVSFSPDGQLLASGHWEADIDLFDVASGKLLKTMQDLTRANPFNFVTRLAFTSDSRLLVSAGAGGTVRLWDVTSGKQPPRPPVHDGPVAWFRFSADGQLLASTSLDQTLRVWDVASGRERWVRHMGKQPWVFDPLANPTYSKSCFFSPDGNLLTVEFIDSTVRILDPRSGHEVRRLKADIRVQTLSPDGRLAAWRDEEGNAQVYDLESGRVLGPFALPGLDFNFNWPRDLPSQLAFSPDSKRLAVVFRTSPVLFDVQSGARRVMTVAEISPPLAALTFSPDGELLAGGSRHDLRGSSSGVPFSSVAVWRTATGRVLFTVNEPSNGFTSVALSLDGRLLAASCGCEKTVRLWEVATGKEIQGYQDGAPAYQPGSNEAYFVSFSPDGKHLASGMEDGTILFWDLAPLGWQASLAQKAGTRELEDWLADLEGEDAAKAYRAVWSLAAVPQKALPFLRPRLTGTLPEPKQLPRLLANLDAEDFATRETASQELAKLGSAAEPALRKALAANPSPEVRTRIENLIKRLGPPPGKKAEEGLVKDARTRGLLRGIWVLERIGNAEAQSLLKELAENSPAAKDARAVLKRLSARPASTKDG